MDPRRIFLLTGLAQGFLWAGWAVAAVPWWTVVLDLSPIRLILLGTALELTVLLGEIPTGVVADVFSRKWSVVASWAVIATAQILSPVSEVFWLLLLWQVLWALGFTLQSGATTAWVTDETGEDETGSIMRHAIVRSIGVIGGVATAFVTLQISITATMQIFGAGSLIFAIWLATAMSENGFTPADRSERTTWRTFAHTIRRGYAMTRRIRPLRIMAIAVALVSMADQAIDRLDLRRLIDLGLPDIDGDNAVYFFGCAWMVMTLLNIPAMLYAHRRAEQFEVATFARLLRTILFCGAAGAMFMALGFSFALALVGWAMRDVARETVEPMAEAWTNYYATSEVRATVLSFRAQAAAGGEVIGGLLLGAIAQWVSLGLAFGAAALLIALSGVQFLRLRDGDEPAVTEPAHQ